VLPGKEKTKKRISEEKERKREKGDPTNSFLNLLEPDTRTRGVGLCRCRHPGKEGRDEERIAD